ncbi:MAG: hypothetical protein QNJ72_19145 [Pleurocapsa sp. MO_226.B13]|nr:hypothetical protein [Pleurocapsa sp. MO_226.B13]
MTEQTTPKAKRAGAKKSQQNPPSSRKKRKKKKTYKHRGYKPEAANEQVLFERITGDFLKNKYFYMKGGYVPRDMKPEQLDRQMIKQFDISFSNRKGSRDVQYVRLGTAYLLVARRKDILKNEGISCIFDVRENFVQMAQWRMRISKKKKLEVKEIKDGEEIKRELKVKFPWGLTNYNKQPKKKKTKSKPPTV